MRETLYGASIVVATAVTNFLGGADLALHALGTLMLFDYITGVIVAFVFKNSPKSSTGGINSAIGFKGICKKLYMVGMVGVANLLDGALGVDFVRTGLVYTLMANELVSIVENGGLMGISMPPVVTNVIDILNQKGEHK